MFGVFKKENNKKESKEERSEEKVHNVNKCISDIVDLVAEKIGNENRVIVPEQAISSCANLIGLLMFLSFGLNTDNMEAGSILLSEQANELGPKVINRLGFEISQYGFKIDQTKITQTRNEKILSYIATLEKTQKALLEIIKKYEYSYEESIIIAISATAFIINNVSSKVDVSEAFGISISSILEASKTVPLLVE